MDENKKKHKMIAQRGATPAYPNTNFTQSELYTVPRELIKEIFENTISLNVNLISSILFYRMVKIKWWSWGGSS